MTANRYIAFFFFALITSGIDAGEAAFAAKPEPERERYFYYKRSNGKSGPAFKIYVTRSKGNLLITDGARFGQGSIRIDLHFKTHAYKQMMGGSIEHGYGRQRETTDLRINDDQATVSKLGGEKFEVAVLPDVIAIAGVEWIHSYMALRRFDMKGGKNQEFSAILLRLKQPAKPCKIQLTFVGKSVISHEGKEYEFLRFHVGHDNGSHQILWTDLKMRIICLQPETEPRNAVTLHGWSKFVPGFLQLLDTTMPQLGQQ